MTHKPDHERIWLSPRNPYDDREWCRRNLWAEIPEWADEPPTEYVRADLVAKAVREAVKAESFALHSRLLLIKEASSQPDGSCFHDGVWKAVCAALDGYECDVPRGDEV